LVKRDGRVSVGSRVLVGLGEGVSTGKFSVGVRDGVTVALTGVSDAPLWGVLETTGLGMGPGSEQAASRSMGQANKRIRIRFNKNEEERKTKERMGGTEQGRREGER
jgi:tetrahydrodipicolinate N-succinyltransferase